MIINNYWTIILVILFLVLIIIFTATRDFLDVFVIGLALDIVILVISIPLCGIMYWFCNQVSTETYITKTELVALNDYTGYKEKLDGYYFLFFGGISSDKSNTYNIRYVYKDDSDVIRIQSKEMNKDNIGFYEDNQKILEIKHEKYVPKLNSLGQFLFKEPMEQWGDHETDYIFHIPKDSIIKDVNIDLK
jgi:hypothetical protein